MKVWVFKINTKRGWEFDEYFRSRARGPCKIGDTHACPSNEKVANPHATE
jgi:hypothetical protein